MDNKVVSFVTWKQNLLGEMELIFDGRHFKHAWADPRFLDCYPDVEGHIVVGNCMEPNIKSGDIVLISKTTPALSDDAVLIEHPQLGRCCQRYHETKKRRWVTSADGEMTLDAKWSIYGVVLLIARPVPEVIIPYNGQLVSVPILGCID